MESTVNAIDDVPRGRVDHAGARLADLYAASMRKVRRASRNPTSVFACSVVRRAHRADIGKMEHDPFLLTP